MCYYWMAPRSRAIISDLPSKILDKIYRMYLVLRARVERNNATIFQKIYGGRLPRLAVRHSKWRMARYNYPASQLPSLVQAGLQYLEGGTFQHVGDVEPGVIAQQRAMRRRTARKQFRLTGF
jgi:hypothetical protein